MEENIDRQKKLRHTYQSYKLGKFTGTHKLHMCIKINGQTIAWHTHMTLTQHMCVKIVYKSATKNGPSTHISQHKSGPEPGNTKEICSRASKITSLLLIKR